MWKKPRCSLQMQVGARRRNGDHVLADDAHSRRGLNSATFPQASGVHGHRRDNPPARPRTEKPVND
jgi:hypothetical protein